MSETTTTTTRCWCSLLQPPVWPGQWTVDRHSTPGDTLVLDHSSLVNTDPARHSLVTQRKEMWNNNFWHHSTRTNLGPVFAHKIRLNPVESLMIFSLLANRTWTECYEWWILEAENKSVIGQTRRGRLADILRWLCSLGRNCILIANIVQLNTLMNLISAKV